MPPPLRQRRAESGLTPFDDRAQTWLARFRALRVDQDSVKGSAPHKPLLLLAVLDLFEAGGLRDGTLVRSPELVVRFQNLWPLVAARRGNKGDIRMPFHALSNDRVWSVFDAEGRPSRARETSQVAQLYPEFLACLPDPRFRSALRRQLVTTYFPAAEQVALFAALGTADEPTEAASSAVAHAAEDPAVYRTARQLGRSARFKTAVVSGYRLTCALTGYRLTTADQLGIVEAAHIHAFSRSRDNEPDNGLALTPTAHVLFDLGLWSVSDDLRVLVKPASSFHEEAGPGGFSLRALAGAPITLPSGAPLRPRRENLAWHRREHGFPLG